MHYKNIGRAINRVDGPDKVTGRSHFSADRILPNTLWGKCLRSPLAHAKIAHFDIAKAKALPGVRAILTAEDIPAMLIGRRIRDMPMLARERVRFVGERIAVVVSQDRECAEEALNLIDIEYEVLPAVFDPVEAMKDGAPLLHEHLSSYVNYPRPEPETPNVHSLLKWELGNLHEGFDRADRIFEHSFRTQRVHQGYLEPYSSLVEVDPAGRVQVWMTNKATYQLREFMAGATGLDENDIVINQVAIGGDFGGKGALMDTPLCYFLARRLNCPVKMVMTHIEDLQAANPRHPSVVTVRTGVKKNGKICAREAVAIFNSGAYGGFKPTPPVNLPGAMGAVGPYSIANLRIHSYSVYTNCVPCGHMRAPGEVQVTFAQESSMDMIAHELAIAPHEFRRMNLLRDGDRLPDGTRLTHVQSRKTLDAAVKAAKLERKRGANIGQGISMAYRVVGLGPATVRLCLDRDGIYSLVTTISDQGTGAHTILLQVAAEALAVSISGVRLSVRNTDALANDTAPGASRVTHVTGTATCRAAVMLQQRIGQCAAKMSGGGEEQWSVKGKFVQGPDRRKLSLAQVAAWADDNGDVLAITETYDPPPREQEVVYFSAQVAEVSVDRQTGAVTVNRIVTTHDVGTIINPITHQGQIEGALIQGLGGSLMEDLSDDDGRIVCANLGEYKMPNINDIPKLQTVLVKHAAGPAPFGAKAIGENSIDLVAPAIANAVYNAVGIRITELPVTAEKVYAALRLAEKKDTANG